MLTICLESSHIHFIVNFQITISLSPNLSPHHIFRRVQRIVTITAISFRFSSSGLWFWKDVHSPMMSIMRRSLNSSISLSAVLSLHKNSVSRPVDDIFFLISIWGAHNMNAILPLDALLPHPSRYGNPTYLRVLRSCAEGWTELILDQGADMLPRKPGSVCCEIRPLPYPIQMDTFLDPETTLSSPQIQCCGI